MPYLPVDLDAKRKAHGIERALGLPRHTVAGGLTDLWEVVWRDKTDVVDDLTLDEAFGPDPRIRSAVVARGFLEPVESGHRVRGAAKWLFGLEGKSRGGKAAKAHLVPGPKLKSAEGPETGSSASAEGKPEPSPSPPFGSPSALTPSTQHPAPKVLKERTYVAGQKAFAWIPEKPTKPDDAWLGMDFWHWAQAKRWEVGLVPERFPNEREVGDWFSAALAMGITVQSLRLGFVEFANDEYWKSKERKPPIPFGGYVSQFERFIPFGAIQHAS